MDRAISIAIDTLFRLARENLRGGGGVRVFQLRQALRDESGFGQFGLGLGAIALDELK